MRACEGCRRRKIKCDAATTNTWPCSACMRLKLQCIPPSLNPDQGDQSDTQTYRSTANTGQITFDQAGEVMRPPYEQQMLSQPQVTSVKTIPPIYTAPVSYANTTPLYTTGPAPPVAYGDPSSSHAQSMISYGNLHTPISAIDPSQPYASPSDYPFPTPSMSQRTDPVTPDATDQEVWGQEDLSDLLGELRVDASGTGESLSNTPPPYLWTWQLNTWIAKTNPKLWQRNQPSRMYMISSTCYLPFSWGQMPRFEFRQN